MKTTLIKIIENDSSHNKNATRYLYKQHPGLWKRVLVATEFLPPDAKAKQRVWHILNDVYERPTCPITGEHVKWWENRYLETISRSAKSTLMARQGKFNNQSPKSIAKRTKTLREGFASGRIKPKQWTPEESAAKYEKITAAVQKKYGVHSTLLIPEVREKQYQTKVRKGQITAREDRTARQLYYDAVTRLTKKSWAEHFDKINPNRLNRSEWDLDHNYSIQAGFRNDIPPYIIGHWTNLRMMIPAENYSKGMKCQKTKKQLFEDVFTSIG
jgi:hypothetical protein